MSDASGVGGGGQAGGSYDGGGAPAPSAQQQSLALLGQGDQGDQPQDQGLANGFLNRVDPAHRSIVEPYVKQWDAGVTRRFQEVHGQLAPYEQIGADPETLATAYQIYQMIDNDPAQMLALLQEAVGGMPGQEGFGQQQAPGAPQQQPQGQGIPQPGGSQQLPGLPPEIQQQFDAWSQKFPVFEQVLETLAQNHLTQQQDQTQAAEDQQLDQYLGLLKQEYGEYDEDFVMAKMMAGMDGEEAVQMYQQRIQGQVNDRSRRPNVPTILGGGGSVPQEGQRIAKASRNDVRGLVANILQAANTQ